MRSLTLFPGLNISSLASSVGRSPRFIFGSRLIGVFPIRSSIVPATPGRGRTSRPP